MIISLDKFKNKGSGDGGNGKYVVTDGTKFTLSEWEYVPEELDFSQVTKFDNMFQAALNLKHGLYLDDWSKVTNCNQMYYNCSSLESVPDMNTSNCTSFLNMLRGTGIVNSPNIDVSNASDIRLMFAVCPNLTRIGVLDTAHLTDADGFQQFCDGCPNLTTLEGIDFSGLTSAPVLFTQADSITNITINGSISFSWENYGFGVLPNLSEDSVISILSAMARCNNPEEPKTMKFKYSNDVSPAIDELVNECNSKGWTITGLLPDPFTKNVDTAAFGDPSNAIPVSFTEFAAAEPSNEQWYELTGVIRRAPGYEKGILVLDDPTGEYTVSEPQVNSWPLEGSPGIFINGITTELNGGFDESFGSVFPGDGSTIIIRTLKHVPDADYNYFSTDGVNLGTIYQGTIIGGKFNSPCAILVQNEEDDNTPGVFFDDGDAAINIPYTGETQELTIPFNWYVVPNGAPSLHENYWLGEDIRRKGINRNIEVIEGAVEGYTHALRIQVDANPYNETINDSINFSYVDSDGNWIGEYWKPIELEANPDSQLGFINVSDNYDGENGAKLPNSADRLEILFNIQNAEYTAASHENLENFNVSFEPTDIEGYTHVAYITYDNKSYNYQNFELQFSNGYYTEHVMFEVEPAEMQSDVDTSVWGNPDEAIPVTMAEFIAAEPSTTQWYEIKGRVLSAPQFETGMMLIQSIDGDTGQTIYFDNQSFENALFVNYCWDVALMNPVEGVDNYWFPGDGANIIIRTLKHSYDTNVDTIERLSEDNNGTTVAGKYNGSPCAVYVGTYNEGENRWGIVGTITDWGGQPDLYMSEVGDNLYVRTGVTLTDDDQFKIRFNNDWDNSYGVYTDDESYAVTVGEELVLDAGIGANNLSAPAGTYDIYFNTSTYAMWVMPEGEVPGTEPEPEPEPEFNFSVETTEVNPGGNVRINYEITNYDSIGFVPMMTITSNENTLYINPEKTYSKGYIDIVDNPDYKPECYITLSNPDSDEQIYTTTLYWTRLENEEPEEPTGSINDVNMNSNEAWVYTNAGDGSATFSMSGPQNVLENLQVSAQFGIQFETWVGESGTTRYIKTSNLRELMDVGTDTPIRFTLAYNGESKTVICTVHYRQFKPFDEANIQARVESMEFSNPQGAYTVAIRLIDPGSVYNMDNDVEISVETKFEITIENYKWIELDGLSAGTYTTNDISITLSHKLYPEVTGTYTVPLEITIPDNTANLEDGNYVIATEDNRLLSTQSSGSNGQQSIDGSTVGFDAFNYDGGRIHDATITWNLVKTPSNGPNSYTLSPINDLTKYLQYNREDGTTSVGTSGNNSISIVKDPNTGSGGLNKYYLSVSTGTGDTLYLKDNNSIYAFDNGFAPLYLIKVDYKPA